MKIDKKLSVSGPHEGLYPWAPLQSVPAPLIARAPRARHGPLPFRKCWIRRWSM